jgi:hypothetical protein
VDQTVYLSMTLTCQLKNLSVKLYGPGGIVYTFGQPVLNQFQCFVSPDPLLVPDAPGANYHMDLATPVKGQWSLQIQLPAAYSTPLSMPVRITFSNQVGLLLIGSSNGPVGKPVLFSLGAMDGSTRVNGLQINAFLYRLDDTSVAPVAIAFADDGLGVDYAGGDAIYSACVFPDQPGNYLLQVEVFGDASTGHFQRTAATGFKAVPQNASITGNFTVAPKVGIPN